MPRARVEGKPRRKAAVALLPGLLRDALYETAIGAGLACVDEVLQAEHVALCGARYVHMADRQALRAERFASSLVLGGRRVAMSRPRGHAALMVASWVA